KDQETWRLDTTSVLKQPQADSPPAASQICSDFVLFCPSVNVDLVQWWTRGGVPRAYWLSVAFLFGSIVKKEQRHPDSHYQAYRQHESQQEIESDVFHADLCASSVPRWVQLWDLAQ